MNSAILGEVVANGVCGSFCPVGRVGLGEDIAYVPGDGVQRNEKLLADLAIAPAGRDEPQLLDLAFSETVRIRGRGSRISLNLRLETDDSVHQRFHAKLGGYRLGFVQKGKCLVPFVYAIAHLGQVGLWSLS